MRAEDLVALAAPHGVDLIQASRQSARHGRGAGDVITRTSENGTRSVIFLPPPKNQARGSGTRSIARPEWTLAEIAQAAADVPEISFRAACFAFAGDRTFYWQLHSALANTAFNLAKQHNWPNIVRDLHGLQRTYLQHLAKLVLDEDANPHLFAVAPELYAIYLQLTAKIWESQVRERLGILRMVWLGWLGEAASIMQPRLSEDE